MICVRDYACLVRHRVQYMNQMEMFPAACVTMVTENLHRKWVEYILYGWQAVLCGIASPIASFAQSKRNRVWVMEVEGGCAVPCFTLLYICVVCSCRKSICITIEVFNVPECGLFGVDCLHLHFRICHMKRCSRLFSHVYGMCLAHGN